MELGFHVSHVEDQVNNFCNYIDTEAGCNAWPTLSPAACRTAIACAVNEPTGQAARPCQNVAVFLAMPGPEPLNRL